MNFLCSLIIIFTIQPVTTLQPERPVLILLQPVVAVPGKGAFRVYVKKAVETEPANPVLALTYYNKALLSQSQPSGKSQEAEIRIAMSRIQFRLGMTGTAFSNLLTAETLYKQAGNPSARIKVLSAMASFCEKNNALTEAEKCYTDILEIQKNLHLPSGLTMLHLADISVGKGDYDRAAGLLTDSIINKGDLINDKRIIADAYLKLAGIRQKQHRYREAESLILQKALHLSTSAGNKAGRIACFNILGHVYQEQKRYSEAKWFFIQANTQSRAVNNVPGIIMSLVNLAKVKIAIGDAGLAVRDLKEAGQLSKNENNLLLLSEVRNADAVLYRNSGNRKAAASSSALSADLKNSVNELMEARKESVQNARVIIIPPSKKIPLLKKLRIQEVNYYRIFCFAVVFVLFTIIIIRYKRKKAGK